MAGIFSPGAPASLHEGIFMLKDLFGHFPAHHGFGRRLMADQFFPDDLAGKIDMVALGMGTGFVIGDGVAFFAEKEAHEKNGDDAQVGKEIEYLVVLGGGIRENGEPSVTLKSRLDRAAEYMRANPSVTVLVTGGKGEKEPWTEAETMARYLESKAEKPHSPILEERAALNTIENFTFSKKMIADREKEIHPERDIACDPPSVLVITNESHLNRALFLARREGYADVSGIPVPTPPVAAPNNYLREVGSYWKFLIRSLLKVFIPSI